MDVVLVHGFPLDARSWDDQRGAVRLHAPDLPGFGANAAPPCETIDDMALAVLAYVDSLNLKRFVLGGLSMGGYVALACWRLAAPAQRPVGLVLADTRAEPDSPEGKQAREVNLALLDREGPGALAAKLLPKLVAPDAPEPLQDRVRAMMTAQRPAAISAALRAMRDRADATATLDTLDVPALFLVGERDELTTPALMRAMAARVRLSTWTPIAGAGHLANLEAPAAFNAALARFAGSL